MRYMLFHSLSIRLSDCFKSYSGHKYSEKKGKDKGNVEKVTNKSSKSMKKHTNTAFSAVFPKPSLSIAGEKDTSPNGESVHTND